MINSYRFTTPCLLNTCPLHHWKFNESSNVNSAVDYGSNATDISKQGSATLGNTGHIGYSSNNPSDNNYFKTSVSSETYNGFTQTMWMKTSTSDNCIYSSVGAIQLRIWEYSGYWGIMMYWDDYFQVINSDNDVPLNQWVHIAITYDLNTAIYYINGTDVGQKEQTESAKTITSISTGAYSSGSYSIEGYIEDFRIYDYALTSTEINSIYNSGSGTYQT